MPPNNQTQIHGQSPDGGKFQLTQHESDSPILPVVQMERLHQFRPDLINWVIQQTQSEADRRWKRQTRVDWFVLVERIGGLILGFLIAALGLGAAMYLAMNNHETTASVVGGGTLVGIVTALVRGRRAKPQEPSPLPAQPQKKKKN